jgi:hypothetical protein
VDCVEVADRLLAAEPGHDRELDEHLVGCARCSHVAEGVTRLDAVLCSTLVIELPLDLQQKLAQLVLGEPTPVRVPWWQRLGQLNVPEWLAQRPQTIAAQGLAAVMLVLASWQVFGWLSAFQPVIGDVAYAMELVVASPAVTYLGNLQVDFQSLGLWSLVGIGGWLISENGLIGRRLASNGLQLP